MAPDWDETASPMDRVWGLRRNRKAGERADALALEKGGYECARRGT